MVLLGDVFSCFVELTMLFHDLYQLVASTWLICAVGVLRVQLQLLDNDA